MNVKRKAKTSSSPVERGPIGRRPARSPRAVFWSVVLVVACLGSLGVMRVYSRVVVLERMYRLSQAQAEHDKLVHELEMLRLEEAALAATARVDRESQRTLGLRPATAERTVPVPAEAVDTTTKIVASNPSSTTLAAN